MLGDRTPVRPAPSLRTRPARCTPPSSGSTPLRCAARLSALPETSGLTGELAARLLRAAAAARPSTVPATATVTLVRTRSRLAWTSFPSPSCSSFWTISRFVSAARAMTPQDLAPQGDTPGGIDTAELQTRADAAEAQLRSAPTALRATGGLDKALLAAANSGSATRFRRSTPRSGARQAASAAAEISKRLATLNNLAAGFTRAGATADALRDQDISRLQIIFGSSFLVLPALDSDSQPSGRSLEQQPRPAGRRSTRVASWLQRMARIRPAVARLHSAMLYVGGARREIPAPLKWRSSRRRRRSLGRASADPAARRRAACRWSPSRRAAATGAPSRWSLDEWVEVLPSAQQITGVSFHQDDPTARAPQTILLAVRAGRFPRVDARGGGGHRARSARPREAARGRSRRADHSRPLPARALLRLQRRRRDGGHHLHRLQPEYGRADRRRRSGSCHPSPSGTESSRAPAPRPCQRPRRAGARSPLAPRPPVAGRRVRRPRHRFAADRAGSVDNRRLRSLCLRLRRAAALRRQTRPSRR